MNKQLTKAVETMVAGANGKRSARTASVGDVVECIREAREAGWSVTITGGVANSYKYSASSTEILALKRTDGSVVVTVHECTAPTRKGGGYGNIEVKRFLTINTEDGSAQVRVDRLSPEQRDQYAQRMVRAGGVVIPPRARL